MPLYQISPEFRSKLPAPTKSDGETGFVHSIESMGTVDGPGIRTVVFLDGCPLRCQYCHNIDVTVPKNGEKMSKETLVAKVKKNKVYFKNSGGGVTFSGGDPLFQTEFLEKCLELCQQEGIHTAVDTSLFGSLSHLKKITPFTDLFMVSVKQIESDDHKKLTGVGNELIVKNLNWLATQSNPIWIRYVLLPGITDSAVYLEKLCAWLQPLKPEKIEVLPYHVVGQPKWKEVGLKYELSGIKTPEKNEILRVCDFFENKGFEVLCNI